MHLSPRFLNILINILLGAAWAVALYGFISGFTSLHTNIFFKFLNGFFHACAGFFLVLLLEAIYTVFKIREDQLKELKEKQ